MSGQVAGTALTLTYDADLDSSSPPPGSRFIVTADPVDFYGPPRWIRGTGTATVSGKTVTVTLAAAVAEGESASVWYWPEEADTSPLRAVSSGPKVHQIWGTLIQALDRTPTIVESVLEGSTLVLYYSEKLDKSLVPPTSGTLMALAFLLAPQGTTNSFGASDIAVHDDVVTLTLPTRTESAFDLSYTVLTENAIQDVAGNKAAAFSSRQLDRSATSDPGAPSLAAAHPAVADQSVLRLTFNRWLDPSEVPSADAFTIGDSVHDTNRGLVISDVATRGSKVELPINPGFLACQDGLSVSYAKPDEKALRNLWGTEAASFPNQEVTNRWSSRCASAGVTASPMGNSGPVSDNGPRHRSAESELRPVDAPTGARPGRVHRAGAHPPKRPGGTRGGSEHPVLARRHAIAGGPESNIEPRGAGDGELPASPLRSGAVRQRRQPDRAVFCINGCTCCRTDGHRGRGGVGRRCARHLRDG